VPASPKLITIVDDEPMIRELLKRRLIREGWRVATAACAERALELFHRDEVAVMLTDVNMPGMNGVELMRRSREVSPDTRFIVMTGDAQAKTAIEAVRLGAFDYVEKPFRSLDEVVECVRRALEHRAIRVNERKKVGRLAEVNEGLRQTVVRRTQELHERTGALKGLVLEAKQAAMKHRDARVGLEEAVRSSLADLTGLARALEEVGASTTLHSVIARLTEALEGKPRTVGS
jgi:DNA-binding NtrC family response regulator